MVATAKPKMSRAELRKVIKEEKLDVVPLPTLTKDIGKAAANLSAEEARYLVDSYYQMQEDRKRSENQVRALYKASEPHQFMSWLADTMNSVELGIKAALDKYSGAHPLGQWARSLMGIGPVITAGLMAHIDPTRAPTAGAVWRFAGLDPTSVWGKGQKRPWNASLKVLCWKVGESFVKVSGRDSFYGKLYLYRKPIEWTKNLNGDFADQAKVKATAVGKGTDAWPWYNGCYDPADVRKLIDDAVSITEWKTKLTKHDAGTQTHMLPPGHIQSRSKRYPVKLFLAHYHEVAYFLEFGKLPPAPYPIVHLGHSKTISVPNSELVEGLEEAQKSR